MLAKIETLITQDNNEIIRDQIAAILAIEKENQKDLALKANLEPFDYDFDVYIERSRPWLALSDEDGEECGELPLVNVSFDNDTFENRGSGVVETQKTTGTFYLDCYAHANKYEDSEGVQYAGDEAASKEADRIARLVRNIIMAGEYTYLGLQGVVSKRYVSKREKFVPDIQSQHYENIVGVRISLQADYYESSPQTAGTDLELLSLDCTYNEDTSQIIFENTFEEDI